MFHAAFQAFISVAAFAVFDAAEYFITPFSIFIRHFRR
jgi:hypothetical protein